MTTSAISGAIPPEIPRDIAAIASAALRSFPGIAHEYRLSVIAGWCRPKLSPSEVGRQGGPWTPTEGVAQCDSVRPRKAISAMTAPTTNSAVSA